MMTAIYFEGVLANGMIELCNAPINAIINEFVLCYTAHSDVTQF